ncbi:MAG TPA: hypothetical protein VGM93_00015 [Acidimicrobiales bacterium]
MIESLIDCIARHLQRGDHALADAGECGRPEEQFAVARDAAQAVAEWLDRQSRSARLLPAIALRSAVTRLAEIGDGDRG